MRALHSRRTKISADLSPTVFSYIKKACVYMLNCVQLFGTSWSVAHQAPLSMEFSRQECWSQLPFPTPGDLPDPGVEPKSPALAGGFCTTEPPGKPPI